MTSIAVPGLERKKDENPFNYTDDQKDEKRLALIRMKELYPGVPTLYADWVYDLCVNTPEAQLKEIMKKVEEVPSRFKAVGGTNRD